MNPCEIPIFPRHLTGLDGQPVHLLVPLDATGLDVQRALRARRRSAAALRRGGALRILQGDRALEPHVTLREQGRLEKNLGVSMVMGVSP